ncbi:MAG: hypothetical protein RLZZ565_1275, partial [Planctomycetota bacterium]
IEFPGRYSQWLEKQRAASAASSRTGDAGRSQPASKPNRSSEKSSPAKSSSGDPFAKVSTSELEKRIEKLERRIREIDDKLMDPKTHADGKASQRLSRERDEAASELEPLEFEWSRRASTEPA